MEIGEIKRRFDLLTKANNENYCLLSELAKELRVRKTDLMQFIEDNRNLFSLATLKRNMSNGKSKNLGMAIKNVYLHVYENPRTDEWLDKQIEENKDYIYIKAITDYGQMLGYCVEEDTDGSRRENLWRNTKEKLERLREQGIVGKRSFYFGGYADSYERIYDYALIGDWKEKLEKNGWRHDTLVK